MCHGYHIGNAVENYEFVNPCLLLSADDRNCRYVDEEGGYEDRDICHKVGDVLRLVHGPSLGRIQHKQSIPKKSLTRIQSIFFFWKTMVNKVMTN